MDDADPELGTGVRRIIGHVRRPISRLRIPANKMKGRDNPPPVIDMPQIMSYIISSRLTAALHWSVRHKSYHRKSYLQKFLHTLD